MHVDEREIVIKVECTNHVNGMLLRLSNWFLDRIVPTFFCSQNFCVEAVVSIDYLVLLPFLSLLVLLPLLIIVVALMLLLLFLLLL